MAEGQAVVLDNPRDPMGILMAGQQQRAVQSYRQQQLGLQQRKASDAEVKSALAHKYEDPGERFRAWGQNVINKANQNVLSVFQGNPNADPLAIRQQITSIQGEADKELNVAREINNIYNEKLESIGQMKDIIDPERAKGILNRVITKDDPYQVDRSILENIEQIPAIYDLNAMVGNAVSDIKEQYRKVTVGELQSSPVGLFMEIRENKMRFKDINKTVDFLLRGDDVTDIGIQQKINGGIMSDRIRYEIAEKEIASRGGDPEDVSQVMSRFREIQYDTKYTPQVRQEMRKLVEQFQQEERDVEVKSMGKFPKESTSDALKKNRLMLRDKNLKVLQNPFDPASDAPKPEAQAAISRIIGGDFGGGKITDAKFEKGQMAISPEWMAKIGTELNRVLFSNKDEDKKALSQTIREAKNHLIPKTGNKIRLEVKTGTIFGEPETQENLPIDLSDPKAEAILNALMNKNPGEANIPLDDVMFFRQGGTANTGALDEDDDDSGFLDE